MEIELTDLTWFIFVLSSENEGFDESFIIFVWEELMEIKCLEAIQFPRAHIYLQVSSTANVVML